MARFDVYANPFAPERRHTPFVLLEGPLTARLEAAKSAIESRIYLPVDSQIP